MEKLDRGVVAVSTGSGIYVGWRMFGTEPDTVGYNVYRDSVKINTSPITDSTNVLDTDGGSGSTYSVAAVIDGVEQALSEPVGVWSSFCRTIDLEPIDGDYEPNDASVGDLDGDGDYEIVLKRLSTDVSKTSTRFHMIEAYHLDGTFMWRINLGPNNLFADMEINPIVYDFDGDGCAEVVLRTSEGNVDGLGVEIGDTDGDDKTDYRDSAVQNGILWMTEGPEFLSVFDGRTGGEITRTDYIARDPISQWGTSGMSLGQYAHRAYKCMMAPAYLNGTWPSIVMGRGIYHRIKLEAWDLRDGQLTRRWAFDTEDGYSSYAGQGNHNLSVADVDGDGFDEIIYGSCTIDHDGTGLYSTELDHGDALHVADLDPDRPGLEVFMPHERANGTTIPLLSFRDAATGEVIWCKEGEGDCGRGVSFDIDPRYPGNECWGANGEGLYDAQGNLFTTAYPSGIGGGSAINWGVWWDGDLLRELLDRDLIMKWVQWDESERWNTVRYLKFSDYGGLLNNGTKYNPCLTADMIGDWREEVLIRHQDGDALMLFTTTDVTTNRIYTLMHDSQYRSAIAWQCNQYNQPPHASFFIGDGMDAPPEPAIRLLDNTLQSEFLECGGMVSMEAENGELGPRWIIGSDSNASGETYIEVDPIYNHTGTSPAGINADYLASYYFNISAGSNYRIWFRIFSDTGSDDSFFWRIDGGSWNLENNRSGIGSWFSTDHAQVDSLAAGSHVLEVTYREDGTRLDKFVIQLDGLTDPAGSGPAESSRCQYISKTVPIIRK
jgi:rhamnogalacturonan endolyase